ncbi:MAG: energy transducer TonB [Ginsengibacter sp.]
MKIIFKLVLILISFVFLLDNVHAQTKKSAEDTAHSDEITLSKVEVEASFPGGDAAWANYITNKIQNNQGSFGKNDYGTCIVKFIVDKNGNISFVEATTMQNTRLAKVVVRAIAKGPKWIPAQQDGKFVNAYRIQPVILTEPDK